MGQRCESRQSGRSTTDDHHRERLVFNTYVMHDGRDRVIASTWLRPGALRAPRVRHHTWMPTTPVRLRCCRRTGWEANSGQVCSVARVIRDKTILSYLIGRVDWCVKMGPISRQASSHLCVCRVGTPESDLQYFTVIHSQSPPFSHKTHSTTFHPLFDMRVFAKLDTVYPLFAHRPSRVAT